MFATAVAYPIQGLIKYHGLRDKELRLPYHDSISVCTAGLETRTSADVRTDFDNDIFVLGDKQLEGRDCERLENIAEVVRAYAGIDYKVHLYSKNNFKSNIGLGASASGFAAAAMAMATAYGIKNMPLETVASIARLGAASAARSVMGGFSLLREDGTAECLADPNELQMGMIIVPVEGFKFTDDAHKDVITSPYFNERVKKSDKRIFEMYNAILGKDLEKIGMLAEKDTRDLHAVTMTADAGKIYWKPDTLRVIQRVKELQNEGIPAFYSIDTGASVYVNTLPGMVDKVNAAIKELDLETIVCEVGGPARIVETFSMLDAIR